MIRPSSEITEKYFEEEEYKVGDMMTEMGFYWMWIINIDEKISILEGTLPPAITDRAVMGYSFKRNLSFELNLKIHSFTKEEFKKHCLYKTNNKYWIDYVGNDMSSTKSILSYYKSQSQDKRDLKIEEIIYNI